MATTPIKKTSQTRNGFKAGEHIVYPAHGVGQITSIEEQEIAGYKLDRITSYNVCYTKLLRSTPGGPTRLHVYNIQGKLVKTLVDGQMTAGTHDVRFAPASLPSGTYLYRVITSYSIHYTKLYENRAWKVHSCKAASPILLSEKVRRTDSPHVCHGLIEQLPDHGGFLAGVRDTTPVLSSVF